MSRILRNVPDPAKTPSGHMTVLLARAGAGDAKATDELLPLVYDELRVLAAQHLGGERPNHTLQPTALVHEAYLRLLGPDGEQTPWQNRAHFFGAAARAIRRILVDHARARDSLKRGGGAPKVSLDEVSIAVADDATGRAGEAAGVDLLALDKALARLAAMDPHKATVVELRFFGGLTVEETARSLGVSESTIAREWQFARVWLHRELSGMGEG
ncbi:MAG TPA: sigma-70 family RNA polymerase sigma factor [Phycisphaerales bacterium]|nr:sigma-70 family RNA polymerase sigma factor [Phycisphaerales bacterium]